MKISLTARRINATLLLEYLLLVNLLKVWVGMSKTPETPESSDLLIEHFSDRSVRRLLQDNEYARGLIEIVAPELVAFLDFSQLSQHNRSFISETLRERESDVLLSVPFQHKAGTDELLIYILIEHQSTVDASMGYRLLSYMMQIWNMQRQAWESEGVAKGEWRLRPILPILFYTGDRHWTVPLSLTAIMDVPDVLSRFVPTFDTLFLGVKAADPSDLTKTGHPLGWLLSVLQKEHAEKAAISEALITAVSHLKALDSEQVSRVRQALLYFIQLILHRRPVEEREDLIELVKRYSDDEMEVETMAQTTAELLIAEGMEKGIAEGQTDAKREAVLKLLHFRFQRIPDSVTEAVASTQSLSRLDALFEKVMAAESLDEIDF